jgi:glucosylceramidase
MAALFNAAPGAAQTPTGSVGTITVRRTDGTKRYAEEPALKWQPAGEEAAGAIVLEPARTYQEMLGFGAALTDASAYMINQLDPATREKFLHELYHPSELAMAVTRLCIGSSDFSTKMYSYDEGEPDPELKRFSIDQDKQYLLPQLRTARKMNPDLFLLACPWSPPGWMKASGTMLGGSLKPRNFAVYAKYFVKYLKAFEAEGVKIDAVTSQNEVDTDQDGRMPACAWAQEHEVLFVSQHLGPAFAENKIQTKIWMLDHNWNLWGRVINSLEEPTFNRYIDGVAWHPYLGTIDAMTRVHDAYPDKHMYWTEGDFGAVGAFAGGGLAGAAPVASTDAPKREPVPPAVKMALGGALAAAAVRNWTRCLMLWNIVLDENGNPNIGPFTGASGTITIDSKTKEITRGTDYWVLKHYTHATPGGSKRFASHGGEEAVAHAAFVSRDDTKVLVLSNTTAGDKQVQVRVGGLMTQITLPAHSITNLSWV